MILGVDSGTWRAYAAVDFDGNLVALKSRKNWTPDEFIAEVAEFSPSIVACDRNPPPRKILLLKSVLGARLYAPKKSLSLLQKYKLADGFRVSNSHERDALASALKAFRALSGKMRFVERKARNAGLNARQRAAVARMVLGGKGKSIFEAITSLG